MVATMKGLGLDQLSSAQRVALALEIWDSLGDDRPGDRLSPSQLAELSERDRELDADPSIAISWDQIRAKLEVV